MENGLPNEIEWKQKLMIKNWIGNGNWNSLFEWLNQFDYEIIVRQNEILSNDGNVEAPDLNQLLTIIDETSHLTTMITRGDLQRARIRILEQKFSFFVFWCF